MPYAPPSGWIENRPPDTEDDAIYTRFHIRPDCPRIASADDLRKVDKPYSATRCLLCASELNQPTLFSSLAGQAQLAGV